MAFRRLDAAKRAPGVGRALGVVRRPCGGRGATRCFVARLAPTRRAVARRPRHLAALTPRCCPKGRGHGHRRGTTRHRRVAPARCLCVGAWRYADAAATVAGLCGGQWPACGPRSGIAGVPWPLGTAGAWGRARPTRRITRTSAVRCLTLRSDAAKVRAPSPSRKSHASCSAKSSSFVSFELQFPVPLSPRAEWYAMARHKRGCNPAP